MSPENIEFNQEEKRIESQSLVFKKELGLSDLVFTQILYVVGLTWIGVAAQQGQAHVLLWLTAMILFYIPSAIVVTYLVKLMPLEGGLYQWAKLGFSEKIGFLVGWNLWVFAIIETSNIGLAITQFIGYLLPADYKALSEDHWFIMSITILIIGTLVIFSCIGLGLGKWVHKVGGIFLITIFFVIILLPFLRHYDPGRVYNPLKFQMPVLSLLTLNILAKLSFGALGGFEYVAIHAGECRNPVQSLSKSILIASPIIAIMFILGTASVLELVGSKNVDLIAPSAQVLNKGFEPLGLGSTIASLAILGILIIRFAQASVQFGGNTRLPMVAGWDSLLPSWFSKLHTKYKTPVHSIVFVGVATLLFAIMGSLGVSKQEAFQFLFNSSILIYGLTYIAMYCIPLFGLKKFYLKVPWWIKLLSASCLLLTVLAVLFALIPIVQVENRGMFAIKMIGVVIIINLIGMIIFLKSRK